MEPRVSDDDLGLAHSWGGGPEVIFLSSPLADPVDWSVGARERLLALGYQVTTFEHRPGSLDWRSAVACVGKFVARRSDAVSLVGWSQGAVIAQEAALIMASEVACTALLATYGRQNEIDRTLQQCWNVLADESSDADPLRLALGLLTAFPPARLADDEFVRAMRRTQAQWAGRPDRIARRRAATFIATYPDRLADLASLATPCLVMGFELDTDTFAARAREVADVLPAATYIELTDVAHAAPITDADRVWPPVVSFIQQHQPLARQRTHLPQSALTCR